MSLSARLNKRVVIQAQQAGQDGYGQPLLGWADVATVWAEVKSISGHEFISAAAVQNSVESKITIRTRPGIVSAMRVKYGVENYNIGAVLENSDGSTVLMCSKGVNDG